MMMMMMMKAKKAKKAKQLEAVLLSRRVGIPHLPKSVVERRRTLLYSHTTARTRSDSYFTLLQ